MPDDRLTVDINKFAFENACFEMFCFRLSLPDFLRCLLIGAKAHGVLQALPAQKERAVIFFAPFFLVHESHSAL